MSNKQEQLQAFERLLIMMDELREKCPWDQKQTLKSLRKLTIEEVYELSEAILENDHENIKEELGDILLHMVFYAKIGSEQSSFDIADICNAICEKMIGRHPHIYGDVTVDNEEDVKRNWEQIKLEKEGKKSIFSGVPKGLPSLQKAYRLQEKASAVGFDWKEVAPVWDKVKEEFEELTQEHKANDTDKIEAELGDMIFSLINYSRFMNIDVEKALERTNHKFISRIQYIEENANQSITEMSLEQMDVLWEEAKGKD